MRMHDYSITFACYNSLEYTKLFVDSLIITDTPLDRVIVVDNGSSDGTREYLSAQSFGEVILNKRNLGCGVAWNQGILARQSEWTVIMNNDVIVSNNWIRNLIDVAVDLKLRVVSPAMIEGELDYDFPNFVIERGSMLQSVARLGAKHAVCLVVHNSVWSDIGYFTPKPKLLGFEDTIFFNELERAHIPTAITGAAWLHHFGSITQDQIKKEKGLAKTDAIGNRRNYKTLGLSWFERKIRRARRKRSEKVWKGVELSKYGLTTHGHRRNGQFVWM